MVHVNFFTSGRKNPLATRREKRLRSKDKMRRQQSNNHGGTSRGRVVQPRIGQRSKKTQAGGDRTEKKSRKFTAIGDVLNFRRKGDVKKKKRG